LDFAAAGRWEIDLVDADTEDMPDVAANSLSIAFGDFRRGYLIVDRAGVRVIRDPFTAKPYILFYTTKRVGGGVQDFDAIKLLKFAVSRERRNAHRCRPREGGDPYPPSVQFERRRCNARLQSRTPVVMGPDWRTEENFAQAKKFLQDMVGAPTSANLNNPDKPWFYYFETQQEDEALREFIRRLRRGQR
jgi:hypothetical protein